MSTTASGSLIVDWTSLSDRSAWILRHVEAPMVLERKTYQQLIEATGISQRRLKQLRKDLETEVRRHSTSTLA